MKVTINYTIHRVIEAEIDDKYKTLLDYDDDDLTTELVRDAQKIVKKLGKPGDDNYVDGIFCKDERDEYGRECCLVEF